MCRLSRCWPAGLSWATRRSVSPKWARYHAIGVEEIIMRCQWPGMAVEPALQAMQRFGRDVLPQCVSLDAHFVSPTAVHL